MRRLAFGGAPRSATASLHRWSGLAILAFLSVTSFSGAYLAFRSEIDRWLNPHLLVVEPVGERLPLSSALATIERELPGAVVTSVYLPQRLDAALSVYLRPAVDTGRHDRHPSPTLPFNQVLLNPYDGRLLGGRNTMKVGLDTLTLGHLMLRLHHTLLLSDLGEWILGISALIWLLTLPLGLALSWPARWWAPGAWWQILTIRQGATSRIGYDLHRSLGVLTLPVAVMLAFSSVYLNLPGLVKPAVHAVSALTVAPARGAMAWPRAAVGIDEAVARAQATLPGAAPYSVTRDLVKGWYAIRLRLPGDISPFGNNYVYVDALSGAVAATHLLERASAGDRFILWQFPLHSGLGFGLGGQAIVGLSGLALTVLNGAGLYVWFVNRRARRRPRPDRHRLATLAVGTATPANPGR